ncbi:hypothetical protein DPMN_123358 [Dreissena polymorpha]|uniref:Uncharacterized protein n=1 Tax=Dreissena polymorpha TaxID=45954 RepID=A0A9D4GU99_DREPO|nr:hypothetical protein DPMN_123358 [Dreissena polymorpha]
MSETGAEREFKPSLDKSGMADTDLFRVKRASLPMEKIWSKPTVTIDDNGVSVCKRYQCTYNR